jgi:two-component system, NtrC family, C4-dicarboxylate transport response regulator DctD
MIACVNQGWHFRLWHSFCFWLTETKHMEQKMSKKRTVLVVVDEVSIRTLLRDFLRIMKYDVTVAADAETARAAAARKHDMLICDLRLEGCDGGELAAELHAEDPDMRVLLVSGQEFDPKIPDGFEFMQKPFSLVKLDERLRAMLDEGVAK